MDDEFTSDPFDPATFDPNNFDLHKARRSLYMNVEGATEEQQRGVAAAEKVLNVAGINWSVAYQAAMQREWGDSFTEEQRRAAQVWDHAEKAAIVACCSGWESVPEICSLMLQYDDMEQIHDLFGETDASSTAFPLRRPRPNLKRVK